MSMKEAFDTFFEEMTQNYMSEWGVPPRALYTEEKNPTGLFLPETLDDKGYAQWKPKLQEKPVSFDAVETSTYFPHTVILKNVSYPISTMRKHIICMITNIF